MKYRDTALIRLFRAGACGPPATLRWVRPLAALTLSFGPTEGRKDTAVTQTTTSTLPSLRFTLVLACSLFVAGCDMCLTMCKYPPGPPTVRAYPDQTVTPGGYVTLQATSTGGNTAPVSFSWSQIGGPTVALTELGIWWAGFQAPDVECDLTFRFTETDEGGSGSDDTVVHVRYNDPRCEFEYASTLSPASPAPGEDIVASPASGIGSWEREGFTWARNGVVVWVWANVFPGAQTSSGDVISLTNIWSDGTCWYSATATAVVR